MEKLKTRCSLQEIAVVIGAELKSIQSLKPDAIIIEAIATIELAKEGDVTFLGNPIYRKYLEKTKASAVIIHPDDLPYALVPALVTHNPRLGLTKLLKLCLKEKLPKMEIHPTAIIAESCSLSDDISIGPNCVIGKRTSIGRGSILQAGVVVGDFCQIGVSVELKANVSLYERVVIGDYSTIHSGTVIGSDGFGYANDENGHWVKMVHLGSVRIGNRVEIGSNVSIDRGFLEDTVIACGVIIDNLVQIGHNVVIGEKTAIAGCVGIAGSTQIGASCLIGGCVSIAGHITIADKVHITATSAVNRSLSKPGIYSSGLPAKEGHLWRRNVARFQFLDDMAKRVRYLERTLRTHLIHKDDKVVS